MIIGNLIHRYESVTSTNDIARDLARAGAAHGTVVVAAAQTRGRGTKGRSWESPGGLGLYASFVLRPPNSPEVRESLSLLPLAAGLGASDAVLKAADVEARLKWPNDLVHGKQKLGGVLAEAVHQGGTVSFAVVGVGINVNQEAADFSLDLAGRATSLRMITGRPQDAERLLGALCPSVESCYNSLIQGEGASLVRAVEARMAFAPGAHLRVAKGSDILAGIYRGLASDGRLRLDAEGREETLTIDDVVSLEWD